MNLLDLAVKITCDDQASGKVDKIGDGIKNTLGTAAKVGGAAVAALGAATVAIGKTALDAYSNYEQLVGGIDTLFKASSGKVQQYAADAYRTAGVSANRYMEISTSFAAALISSLGGDTAKAADMADMAITDMSDNANKMGTSVGIVQEAYQSLSRGNYEMLDSLKLGYGGTKSELERLLSDAEKFSAAQGEVRDFSIDSYSDIVEAIHIVQDEMGITGTTAEEAASTIEGSVNMAKSAWENWLAGLGNESADMGVLTDQLVESVVIAGENIIPRVVQIMSSIGQTVADCAPGVALYLRDALVSVLPEAVQGPMRDAFAGVDKVVTVINGVVAQLAGPLGELGEAFSSVFGEALSGAARVLGDLAEKAGEVLVPALRDNLIPACTDFLKAIEPWMGPIADVADAFGNVLIAAITIFVIALSLVIQTITDVITGIQGLADGAGSGVEAAIGFFSQLPGAVGGFLQSVINAVIGWASSMWSQASAAGSNFLSAIGSYLSALPGNVASWLSGAISTVVGWVSQFASNATSAASQFGGRLRDGLAAIPGTLGNIGANIVQGLVSGVVSAAGRLIDAVRGAVGDAIQAAKNLLGIHSPSRVFRKIGQYTMQGAALGVDDDAGLLLQSTDNAMRGMVSTAQDIKYTPGIDSAETTTPVIEWLAANLGDIIAARTPYIGMRDLGRLGRKAMTYA